MRRQVKTAVLPVAGYGTRFLPATKAIPKEMLPIIDTPMLQYIVDEVVASGITKIILVTCRGKESIENHFDQRPELEWLLSQREKKNLLKKLNTVPESVQMVSVRQSEPLGLGHAVLMAAPLIANDEPFAVLLGDDLVRSKIPCIRQLMDLYEEKQKSVVGVTQVPLQDVSKYGIVAPGPKNGRSFVVQNLIEKPKPEDAPSLLAVAGRYVLDPEIFGFLKRIERGAGSEYQLTDALKLMAQERGLQALEFEGRRYDTGDRLGYFEATVHFGLMNLELGKEYRRILIQSLEAFPEE